MSVLHLWKLVPCVIDMPYQTRQQPNQLRHKEIEPKYDNLVLTRSVHFCLLCVNNRARRLLAYVQLFSEPLGGVPRTWGHNSQLARPGDRHILVRNRRIKKNQTWSINDHYKTIWFRAHEASSFTPNEDQNTLLYERPLLQQIPSRVMMDEFNKCFKTSYTIWQVWINHSREASRYIGCTVFLHCFNVLYQLFTVDDSRVNVLCRYCEYILSLLSN